MGTIKIPIANCKYVMFSSTTFALLIICSSTLVFGQDVEDLRQQVMALDAKMGEMDANINTHFNEELNRIQNDLSTNMEQIRQDLHEKDRMIEDYFRNNIDDMRHQFEEKDMFLMNELHA